MKEHPWWQEFPAAITVCDTEGNLLEMNDKAAQVFAADGGLALIGTNALDCHPEPARSKMAELLKNHQVNAYTIEKKGVKKLIYQAPWFRDGEFAGYVELSMVIPDQMPHFVRSGS